MKESKLFSEANHGHPFSTKTRGVLPKLVGGKGETSRIELSLATQGAEHEHTFVTEWCDKYSSRCGASSKANSRIDQETSNGKHIEYLVRAARNGSDRIRHREAKRAGSVAYFAHHENEVAVCPDCGEISTGVHESEARCILPERSQKALEAWLEGLGEAARKAIRLAAMDMWGPYRGVVKAKLSHAEIVANRFHVMKHLTGGRHQLEPVADFTGIRTLSASPAIGGKIEMWKGVAV